MIDPRRVALQGIGYAALAIASQGFVALDVPVVLVVPAPVSTSGGGKTTNKIPRWVSDNAALERLQREIAVEEEFILHAVLAAVFEET